MGPSADLSPPLPADRTCEVPCFNLYTASTRRGGHGANPGTCVGEAADSAQSHPQLHNNQLWLHETLSQLNHTNLLALLEHPKHCSSERVCVC